MDFWLYWLLDVGLTTVVIVLALLWQGIEMRRRLTAFLGLVGLVAVVLALCDMVINPILGIALIFAFPVAFLVQMLVSYGLLYLAMGFWLDKFSETDFEHAEALTKTVCLWAVGARVALGILLCIVEG